MKLRNFLAIVITVGIVCGGILHYVLPMIDTRDQWIGLAWGLVAFIALSIAGTIATHPNI